MGRKRRPADRPVVVDAYTHILKPKESTIWVPVESAHHKKATILRQKKIGNDQSRIFNGCHAKKFIGGQLGKFVPPAFYDIPFPNQGSPLLRFDKNLGVDTRNPGSEGISRHKFMKQLGRIRVCQYLIQRFDLAFAIWPIFFRQRKPVSPNLVAARCLQN